MKLEVDAVSRPAVYVIYSTETGHRYVGKTTDLKQRIGQYMKLFEPGHKPTQQRRLAEEVQEQGVDRFTLGVLEWADDLDAHQLSDLEAHWAAALRAHDSEVGLNTAPISRPVRARGSVARQAKVEVRVSPEFKEAIDAAAQAHGYSVSELARRALAHVVNEHEAGRRVLPRW